MARREHAASPDAAFDGAALDRAALRVAAYWNDRSPRTEGDAGLQRALPVIIDAIHAIARGEVAPDFVRYSWTAHAPQLLGELRRELLGGGMPSDDAMHDVLRTLQAMECVNRALEQDVASRLAEQLTGASALPLLMAVAHDMRSPLTSILFLVERLRHGHFGPVSPIQERHLALVYSAAFGLSSMASDLMELPHGGVRLLDEPALPFSIAEALRVVRDLVQPMAEEKGLVLRFSGPMLDMRIGQAAALSRVLLNLTTNALKYTDTGSVTVLAEMQSDGRMRFLVEDTGRGVPPGEADQIFDVVRERDQSLPDQPLPNQLLRDKPPRDQFHDFAFSSTGLGLATCRKLVAAMGGRLQITTELDRGTRCTFVLDLPAAPRH